MIEYNLNGTKVKVFASEFDSKTPYTISNDVLDIFDEIYLMPDTHVGKSVPIGFVAKYDNKIIPSIVGVDIGCGVMTYDIPKQKIDFKELEQYINKHIPSGFDVYSTERSCDSLLRGLSFDLRNESHIKKSLGTLGGGNHFIEIVSRETCYTVVVHTGSRNLGKQVCEYHESKLTFDKEAYEREKKRVIDEYKANGKQHMIQDAVSMIDKSKYHKKCLTDAELDYYINDMKIAQNYAFHNRLEIMNMLLKYFKDVHVTFDNLVDIPHNYIDFNNRIIHKGSIDASKGKSIVMPLNMRDGVVFAKGSGNSEWLCSAPHGAGRRLSRGQAKQQVSMSEFIDSMRNVYTFSVTGKTLDESPQAYKDATQVISDAEPTMCDIEIGKPIYNFKAK